MRFRWDVFIRLLLLALTVAPLHYAGIELRRWAFEQSTPIRFGDIYRGWRYGLRASEQGYFDLYDRVVAETFERGQYNELDYAPLRLAVMKTWADLNRARGLDTTKGWQRDAAFSAPVLTFNTALEAFGAVGAFLLTRLWWIRAYGATAPPVHADLAGLVAAALLWLNPAMVLSSQCWPTWDVWVPVFYVWAVYFASHRLFFLCGLTVAVGALFKGQQWIVAPIFVLYPLLLGRWGDAVKWLIGALFGVMLLTSPWALRHPPTPENLAQAARLRWSKQPTAQIVRPSDRPVLNTPALATVGGLTLAALLGTLRRRDPSETPSSQAPHVPPGLPRSDPGATTSNAAVGGGGVSPPLGPKARSDSARRTLASAVDGGSIPLAQLVLLLVTSLLLWNRPPWSWLLPLAVAVVLVIQRFARPAHWRWALAALVAGGSLAACYPAFDASATWLYIGWGYGTHHWEWLIMGHTSNLPGLLAKAYGWNNEQDLKYVVATVFGVPVTLKKFLAFVYGLCLALSALAAARHARAADARFLLAMTAPWACMFAFLGQIHERYLLFAAGFSMCLVAVGWRWALLGLFWSAVTFVMTLHVMLLNPDAPHLFGQPPFALTKPTADTWLRLIAPTHPGLGWAVTLSALVVLTAALSRPRRTPI